eukprot:COSAG01_NODE_6709_length_3534_cov_2.341776_2_plen_792_part_00
MSNNGYRASSRPPCMKGSSRRRPSSAIRARLVATERSAPGSVIGNCGATLPPSSSSQPSAVSAADATDSSSSSSGGGGSGGDGDDSRGGRTWAGGAPLRVLRRLPPQNRRGGSGGSSSSDDDDDDDDESVGGDDTIALALDSRRGAAVVVGRGSVQLYKWLAKVQIWLFRRALAAGAEGAEGEQQQQQEQLRRPCAVAVASEGDGQIVVADAEGGVVVFSAAGKYQRVIGRGRRGRGALHSPTAVAANAQVVAAFDDWPPARQGSGGGGGGGGEEHEKAAVHIYALDNGALLRVLPMVGYRVSCGGLAFDGGGHLAVLARGDGGGGGRGGGRGGARLMLWRLFDGSCARQLGRAQLGEDGSSSKAAAAAGGGRGAGGGATAVCCDAHGRYIVAGTGSTRAAADAANTDATSLRLHVFGADGQWCGECSLPMRRASRSPMAAEAAAAAVAGLGCDEQGQLLLALSHAPPTAVPASPTAADTTRTGQGGELLLLTGPPAPQGPIATASIAVAGAGQLGSRPVSAPSAQRQRQPVQVPVQEVSSAANGIDRVHGAGATERPPPSMAAAASRRRDSGRGGTTETAVIKSQCRRRRSVGTNPAARRREDPRSGRDHCGAMQLSGTAKEEVAEGAAALDVAVVAAARRRAQERVRAARAKESASLEESRRWLENAPRYYVRRITTAEPTLASRGSSGIRRRRAALAPRRSGSVNTDVDFTTPPSPPSTDGNAEGSSSGGDCGDGSQLKWLLQLPSAQHKLRREWDAFDAAAAMAPSGRVEQRRASSVPGTRSTTYAR